MPDHLHAQRFVLGSDASVDKLVNCVLADGKPPLTINFPHFETKSHVFCVGDLFEHFIECVGFQFPAFRNQHGLILLIELLCLSCGGPRDSVFVSIRARKTFGDPTQPFLLVILAFVMDFPFERPTCMLASGSKLHRRGGQY